jgi:uncharacterized membrane protein YiaA
MGISLLGCIMFLAGGVAIFAGLITFLIGLFDADKQVMKKGALILAGGSVSLLVSFSLCSKGIL